MKHSLRFVLALLFVLPSGAYAQQKTIEVQGPYTLILLGQRLNQLYQRQQPLVNVRVHSGNIRTALSSLHAGEIDIAQAQGSLGADEVRGLVAVPVGVEGIVFYVHESNPLSELTIAQLRGIYTGQILNWKQLGGPDQRILLYGGESTTGIGSFFSESVLRGDDTFGYENRASTKALLETIVRNPSGIGFASLDFAPHVKILRIRASDVEPAVDPSFVNIRSLKYPVARYVYWYFSRKPQGALKDFCHWIFSSEGQLVVESVGFQPLMPEQRAASLRKLGIAEDR
jgi:phosphate transport system substrate-binding protein